jgi:IS30 family transposase
MGKGRLTMNKRKHIVPLEELQRMRDLGMTNRQIADRLGCSRNTVNMRFNEDAYRARLAKMVDYRAAKKANAPVKQARVKDKPSDKPFRIEDYLWPQQTIVVVMPPDTRDLTGKLLGDPIPGRGFVK